MPCGGLSETEVFVEIGVHHIDGGGAGVVAVSAAVGYVLRVLPRRGCVRCGLDSGVGYRRILSGAVEG